MIRINNIIVKINITGSILATTDDNVLLPSLCGSFDILPVIASLINPTSRQIWYNREYNGSTTPSIELWIVVGNNELPITGNQLQAMLYALRSTSLGYVD